MSLSPCLGQFFGLSRLSLDLAICREQYGDEDEATLNAIDDLALELRDAGLLDEAECLYRELLDSRQKTLEPDDFLIARSYRELAVTLEAAGRYQDALEFAKLALDHRLRYFEGPLSLVTHRERVNVSRILVKLGDSSEALSLLDELEDCLKIHNYKVEAIEELLLEVVKIRAGIAVGS